MNGLTVLGGAKEIALTSAGFVIGTLTDRFLVVTATIDAAAITLPNSTGNVEGGERWIIHNAGVRAFILTSNSGADFRVETNETVFVGANEEGYWAIAYKKQPEDGMSKISKTITLTELAALGAVSIGEIKIGDLPIGARPLQLAIYALQDAAFTSSAGSLTDLKAGLVLTNTGAQATNPLCTPYIFNLDLADKPRGVATVEMLSTSAETDLPIDSDTGMEAFVRLDIDGASVNFDTLTAPTGNVFVVEVIYAR